MDLIANLSIGFAEAFSLHNLLLCFFGVLIGTLVGVLPGLGPATTIAVLLPATFAMPASGALIMLAGIYYGAQYGGSTTAILIRLPGEASSAVSCLDGYEMARKGRAGSALAIAAIASFFAGTVATVFIAIGGPYLASFADQLGQAEYFSLVVLGLIAACSLGSGSLLQAVAMMLLGIMLGLVGTDKNAGMQRMTFGILELYDGIGIIAVAIGLYGVSEVIKNFSEPESTGEMARIRGRLWPSAEEARAAAPAVLRGTTVGGILGLVPGGGAIMAAFAAYALEKKVSQTPERFGQGAVEGLASAEAANNSAAQSSFVPLLVLGIPENAVTAMMAGAMIMQGIQPGPQVITAQPVLFWGVIVSMWIGNLMLLVLNLPLVGLWASLVRVPFWIIGPCILLVSSIGVYSIDKSALGVSFIAIFGVIGYVLAKLNCNFTPLLLGFILGPMLEENLRRALTLSEGDYSVFITRPLSASMLAVATLFILIPLFREAISRWTARELVDDAPRADETRA